MPGKSVSIVPLIGLLVGIGIGFFDSRPGWDDTGVTAGAVFLVAAVLGAARPRVSWLTGLAVGLPVLAMNALLHSNFGSAIALGIGLAGAGVGYAIGKAIGFGGR